MKTKAKGFVLAFHSKSEAVLVAAPCLTERELVNLVGWMHIAAEAIVVAARRCGWSATKLRALSKATEHADEKEPFVPETSAAFAAAAKLLSRDRRSFGRIGHPTAVGRARVEACPRRAARVRQLASMSRLSRRAISHTAGLLINGLVLLVFLLIKPRDHRPSIARS